MKSVSIVYRRSKTTRDLSNTKEKPKQIRRAVDEYYTKLVQKQKGKNKEELIQKIRSHTARASRMKDRKKVFSSLSIAAIIPPSPGLQINKSSTQRKVTKVPLLNIKRTTNQNFFTLNLPQYNQESGQSPIIFKRQFKQGSSRHAKLKILQKPKCNKQATLILSIDLIYNQFNFWNQEHIDESAIKIWKLLSNLTNLIWIVRRQSSYRKLLTFSQSFNLRLDGVVQIQPSKAQSLTVSYLNLEKQMKLLRTHKLLIINTVRNQSLLEIGQEEFRNSLPIINHPLTYIHFAQINMSDKNRFSGVRKIVSKPLPEPFPMKSILKQHIQRKSKFQSAKQDIKLDTQAAQATPPINTLQQIQNMKQKFLIQFGQSIGLTTKLENGDSVNFLIGDMLRRNYQIAKTYFNFCHQTSLRKDDKELDLLQEKLNKKYSKLEYNRNIYMWNFIS